MKLRYGFTLIESVVVMVIIGVAMITITSFIAPQIARSGDPHYQTRAIALGQSLMSQILSRGFDHNGDFTGTGIRCGEGETGTTEEFCSGISGAANTLGADEAISLFNDVDDYIGCWEPNGANGCNDLSELIGDDADTYQNFRIEIAVDYDASYHAVAPINEYSFKRIDMTISASNQSSYTLTAFRGNY
ncbi:type II secretion system protein [Vibrio sp. T187]|uniref:type IV pilus modification PilV family protein n=1 Tax=Vibrio TaxID=662 RepID=UPI0010C9E27C|nr:MULTISPECIES: type II secretion system protein [Vibrio]MBW3697236.1 type II secretion system protein [Vibrio sp. T187]